MPYVEVNGLRLFYEEYGSAEAMPVLLLPGLGDDHRGWLEVSWRLRESRRVIALDPRDAGFSARAPQPYTIAGMAADTVAFLAALGIQSADVVGYSMGGAIAQEVALTTPSRVRSLSLIATYDAGDARGTAIFEQFSRMRRTLPREAYYRMLLPWIYSAQEFERLMPVDEVIRKLAADSLYQEHDAYDRQMRAAVAFRSRERLAAITCPTLLVFGDEDLFTPLRFARSLESGIPGSRLVILAGAGHALLWSRSAEVAALIEAFLSTNPLMR